MKTEKFETKNSERLTIRGEVFIPEGSGPFPGILYLHGLAGTYREGHNRFFLEYLADKGYLSVGFDFTHEALSESGGKIEGLTIAGEKNDAVRVLDFMAKEFPIESGNIGLVGHSMGGVVACMVGVDRPNDIKSLGLISTVWDPKHETFKHIGTTRDDWRDKGKVPFPAGWEIDDKELSFAFYESLLNYEPRQVVPLIKQPTVVIHGELDETVDISDAYKYFNTLKGEKELVLIKDGGHTYERSHARTAVAKALASWFSKTIQS